MSLIYMPLPEEMPLFSMFLSFPAFSFRFESGPWCGVNGASEGWTLNLHSRHLNFVFLFPFDKVQIMNNCFFVSLCWQKRDQPSPRRGLTFGEPNTFSRIIDHPALSNRLQGPPQNQAQVAPQVRTVMYSQAPRTRCPCPGSGALEAEWARPCECSAAVDRCGDSRLPVNPRTQLVRGDSFFPRVEQSMTHGRLMYELPLPPKSRHRDLQQSCWLGRHLLIHMRLSDRKVLAAYPRGQTSISDGSAHSEEGDRSHTERSKPRRPDSLESISVGVTERRVPERPNV